MNKVTTVSDKTGLAPGTLIHVGQAPDTPGRITAIDYARDFLEEFEVHRVEDLLPCRQRKSITWVNIEGLNNIGFIESLGAHFDIHPLVLEDILNTHQRPKIEEHEQYLFLALKHVSIDPDELAVDYEQVSMLIFEDFVFTFRERSDDLFQPVRDRLTQEKSRLRGNGVDYLAYVILDNIVDNYFSLQDALDIILESVEEDLLAQPGPETLALIQRVKRELIFIRRSISPVREILTELLRSDSPLIQEKMHVYYRDILDHAIRLLESIDAYRDLITGMLDVYLSSVSNRMNEIMKVLTVFASIFIPLTFVAGIYGMNFEYMPELKWKWSYPVLWLFFVLVPIFLLVYFRRKKWL
ncbi:MAG: magnesium/cobalt transporter CorA [Desulfobulbaceae bacterium]|jgi:magnesium transporter